MAKKERELLTFFAENNLNIDMIKLKNIGANFERKLIYVNTCTSNIVMVNRRNEKVTLCEYKFKVNYNERYLYENQMEKRGLYVLEENKSKDDGYRSFYNQIKNESNEIHKNEYLDFDNLYFSYGPGGFGDINTGHIQYIRLNEFQTGHGNIPFQWTMVYFIPEEKIPNYDSLYIPDIDCVISFCEPYDIKNHPYSEIENHKRKLLEFEKINNGNQGISIIFIDRTHVLGNLFLKTNNGCIMIKPIENPDSEDEDGVYIHNVWFDVNYPRDNKSKLIHVSYDDVEKLAEYGIYHNYFEAMTSEKLKDNLEKEKIKFQYHKEKEAHNDTKLKEYSKILGYTAAIVTALIPVVIKINSLLKK